MLAPREDRINNKLMYHCRMCQYSEEASSACVFRNSIYNVIGETAGVTQDVGSDPTVGLPDLWCTLCGQEITCELCGGADDDEEEEKKRDGSKEEHGVNGAQAPRRTVGVTVEEYGGHKTERGGGGARSC